jgi:tetratricopeptide (TPR) repeat protein
MLSEEALIVLAAFGACGLLALGVAELLWPARRRHSPPRQRPPTAASAGPPPPPAAEPARLEAPPPLAEQPPAAPSSLAAAAPTPARSPRGHRANALARHGLEPGRSPYVRRASAPAAPGGGAPTATAVDAAAGPREDLVVERCFALHQARRNTEAVALGLAALGGADAHPADAHATAALWSVIALARQDLGDDAGARAALESAITIAPDADRATYQRQLATLADGVARDLLAQVDKHPRPESEECLAAVRCAALWAECGATAMPADGALADLTAAAQATVWSACERTVVALVQRQDFRPARRLLREALADPRFPAERVVAFRELFSTTYSGEIGQLTAQALRSVQDGREIEALRALRRAEALLGTLNDAALSPTRREEVGRRLSWGYARLGERRVVAGEHEAALEPLFQALGYEADPERRRETRVLLARALDAAADARALGIRALADGGNRETALAHCDALWALLHGAADRGLPRDDLADSLTKVRRLFENLGMTPRD